MYIFQDVFHCRFQDSPDTPFNKVYNTSCTGYEVILATQFMMEAQLQFVSDSVMAFAYAFKVSPVKTS